MIAFSLTTGVGFSMGDQ